MCIDSRCGGPTRLRAQSRRLFTVSRAAANSLPVRSPRRLSSLATVCLEFWRNFCAICDVLRRMNNVKALLLAASILALASSVLAQSQQKKAGETITGTVTRDGTSQPLPNVQVSLTKASAGNRGNTVINASGANTVLTDTAGRFVFSNLQPGSYTITAQLEGYFATETNGTSPELVQTPVTVEEGRSSTLALTLAPAGTITGRILDFDGAIVQNLNVQALRITESGFDTPPAGSRTTDDRGAFRLFGMPPGYYYLAVSAGARSSTAVSSENLSDGTPARTYFPGVLELATASVVRLRSGEEMGGIDFKLKRVIGRTISGQVGSAFPAQAPGNGPPSTPETTLTLLPHDRLVLQDPETSRSMTVSLGTPANGQFQFTNIAPGTYDLFATVPDILGYGAAAPPGRALQPVAFGRTTIDVRGSDLTGVSIIGHHGVEVRGRMLIDGIVSPSAKGIRLTLRADDSASKLQVYQQVGQYQPLINEDGRFTIPAVPEAHYRFHIGFGPEEKDSSPSLNEKKLSDAEVVNADPIAPKPLTSFTVASLLPDNSYVADIRQNGMSVFDSGISVTSQASAPVEIFINTNGGSVDGIVRDGNLIPASGATVALVPQEQHRQNPALYKSARSDAAGRFLLTGIAPGNYKLFAWDSIPPGAYRNATFVSQYEDQGMAVNVSPAIPLHTGVKLIPAR